MHRQLQVAALGKIESRLRSGRAPFSGYIRPAFADWQALSGLILNCGHSSVSGAKPSAVASIFCGNRGFHLESSRSSEWQAHMQSTRVWRRIPLQPNQPNWRTRPSHNVSPERSGRKRFAGSLKSRTDFVGGGVRRT